MPNMVPGGEETSKAREISLFCEYSTHLIANVATVKLVDTVKLDVRQVSAILPVDTEE
jgi:hypothetical protein